MKKLIQFIDDSTLALVDEFVLWMRDRWGVKHRALVTGSAVIWLAGIMASPHGSVGSKTFVGLIAGSLAVLSWFRPYSPSLLRDLVRRQAIWVGFRLLALPWAALWVIVGALQHNPAEVVGQLGWLAFIWLSDAITPDGPRKIKRKQPKRALKPAYQGGFR